MPIDPLLSVPPEAILTAPNRDELFALIQEHHPEAKVTMRTLLRAYHRVLVVLHARAWPAMPKERQVQIVLADELVPKSPNYDHDALQRLGDKIDLPWSVTVFEGHAIFSFLNAEGVLTILNGNPYQHPNEEHTTYLRIPSSALPDYAHAYRRKFRKWSQAGVPDHVWEAAGQEIARCEGYFDFCLRNMVQHLFAVGEYLGVFPTKEQKKQEVTVLVNGTPRTVVGTRVDYLGIVRWVLSSPEVPEGLVYSVTYTKGPSANPEGILHVGKAVEVKEGMVFCAARTNNA